MTKKTAKPVEPDAPGAQQNAMKQPDPWNADGPEYEVVEDAEGRRWPRLVGAAADPSVPLYRVLSVDTGFPVGALVTEADFAGAPLTFAVAVHRCLIAWEGARGR